MKQKTFLWMIVLLMLIPSCQPQSKEVNLEEVVVESQEESVETGDSSQPIEEVQKEPSDTTHQFVGDIHDYLAQITDPAHITVGIVGELTLDPAKTGYWKVVQGSDLLFLSLTRIDPKTGEVLPELAIEWEQPTEFGMEWILVLRDDVSWVDRDGEIVGPVTAYDAVFAIQRALDRRTEAIYPELLYIIENAEEVHALEAPTSEDLQSIGVWAEDDYTLKFRLVEPASYFPVLLSLPIMKPVPQRVIEEFGDAWIEPGYYWSNGPYLFAHLTPEEMMVLCGEITENCSAVNPHYYGIDGINIHAIELLAFPTAEQAIASYLGGELDFVEVYSQDWDIISNNSELMDDIHPFLDYATAGLGFNTSKPPLDDVLVRQALAHTINREMLIASSSEAWKMPAITLTPPGMAGSPAHDPEFPHLAYDPELAIEKLKLAGYPGGAGLPKITLMVRSFRPEQEKMAEQIVQAWKEHLGIEVRWSIMDPSSFYDQLDTDPPDIFLTYWYADYPDPHGMLFTHFHSTEGSNRIRWSNAEFDQLTSQAASERDPTRRRELYKEAEKLLTVDEAGIMPLYHYTRYVLVHQDLEIENISAYGGQHFDIWKVKAH